MFLEILQTSQENTCARVFFFWEKALDRCFRVNFAKFLRTPFLQNISGGYFCSENWIGFVKSSKCYFNLYRSNLRSPTQIVLVWSKITQKWILNCLWPDKEYFLKYCCITICCGNKIWYQELWNCNIRARNIHIHSNTCTEVFFNKVGRLFDRTFANDCFFI